MPVGALWAVGEPTPWADRRSRYPRSRSSTSSSRSTTRSARSSRASAGCTRTCRAGFPFSWRITDRRQRVDRRHLGRTPSGSRVSSRRAAPCTSTARAAGFALRSAWSASDADVVAYMDVDLSTDLDALLPLVAPLVSGHSDVAIGSRLAPGSHVARPPEARAHLAQLQPDPARGARDACARRAVRIQGGARRRGAAPAARDRGRRLVLRHRAARCSPSTTGCASTRCRSTGSTTPTAGSTSCRPRSTTCRARRAWPFGSRRAAAASTSVRRRARPLADDFGRRFVSFSLIGVASTAVSLVLFLATHDAIGPIAANVVRGHRDVRRQRVGERALHRTPDPAALGAVVRVLRGIARRRRAPRSCWSTRSRRASPSRSRCSSRPGRRGRGRASS